MFVEVNHNVDEMNFENFTGGDLIYCGNETFIVLADEIFNSSTRETFNAVNIETGELVFFSPKHKVICPSDYTLTVDL